MHRDSLPILLTTVVVMTACCATLLGVEPPKPLTASSKNKATPIVAPARPLFFDRPIFAIVQPAGRATAPWATSTHRRSTVLPKPPPAEAPKSGAVTPPTGVNPNPPPAYGSSSVPVHRQNVGF